MSDPSASSAHPSKNVDAATVDGFGAEWTKFDFAGRPEAELDAAFVEYFSIFPWDTLPPNAAGFDAGCGSGRWAARVAPRVGHLDCIDASGEALAVASRRLEAHPNCECHHASIGDMPLADASMDFGYSLGVLHHMPDPAAGLRACVRKLKSGAPFLLYLYYALDNRSPLYRAAWRATDIARRGISALPFRARFVVSQVLAASVYFPLAKAAWALERVGLDAERIPLAYYKDRSFYVMRNDALDRFGTRLERRFTREQIRTMMLESGLERITFRDAAPYWCAIGYRTATRVP